MRLSPVVIFCWLLAKPLLAAAPAVICEQAAIHVAAETGVPVDILGPLTLTETGRALGGSLRPWAWAVNAAGEGTWFEDAPQAMHFARSRIDSGHENIDIGCFQINYRWHGENFSSLSEMFDPLTNTRYAARFLQQLYQETGDWRQAAGAFHSRRPADANRYLARFDQLRTAFIQGGFQGGHDGQPSYNDFSDQYPAGMTGRGRRREVTMLLGASIGSRPDGGSGSLAVMGEARTPFLRQAAQGGLLPQGSGRNLLN